jgi:hypothetical protein
LEVVSLTFSVSTGAASASKSTRHLWNVFPWWFPRRHRLRVLRGCERFRIHVSPLEVVSLMISHSAAMIFSLNISE